MTTRGDGMGEAPTNTLTLAILWLGGLALLEFGVRRLTRSSGTSRQEEMSGVRTGRHFVIIDKRTGNAVGRDIYDSSREADAALEKMGGEEKTGYQVMDAMWHNPSRSKLKAMGFEAFGRTRITRRIR